jgi:hypothetical protein
MIELFGLKIAYESIVFIFLFLSSEVIGASKLKENGIVQIILTGINALKPLRKEDEQIDSIKDVFK